MSPHTYAFTSLADLNSTIDAIEPAVAGLDSNDIAMACIAIAIMSQDPDITISTLSFAIKSVSEHIALLLANTKGVN